MVAESTSRARDGALSRPALTVDGRDYTLADVMAVALYLSEWDGVERRTRDGTAALERASAQPAEADVRAARATFRRARGLLSAEEMEAWLARRALTADAWIGWVRTDLARRGVESAVHTGESSALPVDSDALWAEALCSGALARAAQRLAELLVTPETGDEPPGRQPPDPAPLGALGVGPAQARTILQQLPARESAEERLADRIATPHAVEERLRARQTEWLAVEFRALAVPEETVAREALLCVRDDGMALEEVGRLAGAEPTRERALLAETPPELQAHLLSATPGELIGPLERGDEIALLLLDAKISPSPDDPELAGRARRELLDRHLEREMATRVRWHDRL